MIALHLGLSPKTRHQLGNINLRRRDVQPMTAIRYADRLAVRCFWALITFAASYRKRPWM